MAKFLYRKATTEGPQCVTVTIFWMKTRGGWKETAVQEVAGPVTYVLRWQTDPEGDIEVAKTIPGERLIEG